MTTRDFSELSEQEVLALAITLEEEDQRTYEDFAAGLRQTYPDSASIFSSMAGEENGHRHRLLDLYQTRFGDHVPLIRRHDVKGFVPRRSVWLDRPLGLDQVRKQAELMEAETRRFYTRAASLSEDTAVRQLLGDLAAEESRHEARAEKLETTLRGIGGGPSRNTRQASAACFLLQVIQPGLAGINGWVGFNPGADVFAAAFATREIGRPFSSAWQRRSVPASSMGFAEALSDNGSLTGRGRPVAPRRGVRPDDGGRRPRHALALFDPGVLDGDDRSPGLSWPANWRSSPGCAHRFMDTPLWSATSSDRGRRPAGLRNWDPDRQFLGARLSCRRARANSAAGQRQHIGGVAGHADRISRTGQHGARDGREPAQGGQQVRVWNRSAAAATPSPP